MKNIKEGPGRELPPQKYAVYIGFGRERKIVKKGLSYNNALKLHSKIEKLGKHDDYGMDSHRDWNDKNGKQIKEYVNEARQLRVGEAAKKGRWEVYDNKTDKTIKIVKNAAAATRLMNRLMDTGNYDEIAAKWIGDEKDESVNEDGRAIMKSISNAKKGAIATGGGYSPFVKMGKNAWKQKKTNTKSHDDGIFDKIGMFKDFMIDEKIERGNEVHAETKKELKAAIAKSMREILDGKVPKYDIINGMTGEMIAWKDGKEYIWQPSSIPYAERELK